VDALIAQKKSDLKHVLLGVMDDEKIRLREEVQEQIRCARWCCVGASVLRLWVWLGGLIWFVSEVQPPSPLFKQVLTPAF